MFTPPTVRFDFMKTHVENILIQLDDLQSVTARLKTLAPLIEQSGLEIKAALQNGRKLLTAGNGGSAADAL